MKITFANEVENIKDGSYTAILRDAFEFAPENLCMKFAICGDPCLLYTSPSPRD